MIALNVFTLNEGQQTMSANPLVSGCKLKKAWLLVFILLFEWPLNALSMDLEEYLSQAQTYFEKGEYSTAVIQLKNALLLDPNNAEARFLLGNAYLKLDDGSSAVKELKLAQELGVPRERVLAPLGRAWLMSGQNEKVLRDLIVQDGDSLLLKVDILELQGKAYLADQNYSMADEKFSGALELLPESVEALLGKSMIAYHDKDIARAREFIERAVAIAPDNKDAWNQNGDVLRLSGKPQEAINAYQKVLDYAPKNIPALLGKAMAYTALGQQNEALAEANLVISLSPGQYLAYYVKALILYQRQNLMPAQQSIEIALKIRPDYQPGRLLAGYIAYHLGNLNQAVQYLNNYISHNSDDRNANILLAATYLKLNEYNNVIKLLEPRVSNAPDDAQYLTLLGSAYLDQGEASKGLEVLERAIAAAPDVVSIRTNLAIAMLAQGDTGHAVSELQGLIERDQDLVQVDIMLVIAYLQAKDYGSALKSAHALIGKMPDNPIAINLTGLAYYYNGEQKKAKDMYESALKIQPDFLPAHLNLAQLDLETDNMSGARRQYLEVLSYEANNLVAQLALAALAERNGDSKEVEKWLIKAHDDHPEAIKPALMLINHYLQENNTQQALDTAQQTWIAYPRNPVLLELLAMAQLKAGYDNDAATTLHTLTEVKPDSHEAHYQLATVQLKQRNYKAARFNLERALELEADYPVAQLALGRIDIQEQNFDGALKTAVRMQKDHPDKSFGYELEGDVYAAKKEAKQASRTYMSAYSKEPSSRLARKLFQARLQAGETESAYAAINSWLVEHPEDATLRTMLAMALQRTEHQQRAMEEYRKVLEYEPDNLAVLNNLALLYNEAGNPDGVKYAEHAHDLAPDKPEITDTLGWILVQNGDTNRGLVLLQEARVKAPHIPDIQYHMAFALNQAGRSAEARKELDRLLRSNQAFPDRDKAIALRDQLAKQ